MVFQVVLDRGEDGYFVASCPALKSCWSQGRTREEALSGIREAIDLHLDPDPSEVSAEHVHQARAAMQGSPLPPGEGGGAAAG